MYNVYVELKIKLSFLYRSISMKIESGNMSNRLELVFQPTSCVNFVKDYNYYFGLDSRSVTP